MSKKLSNKISKKNKFDDKYITNVIQDVQEYGNNISIKELVKFLTYATEQYYNTDNPVISDLVYDKLETILRKRDKDNSYFKNIGAQVAEKDKVKLPCFMGSLEKIKPDNNLLDKWVKKYKGPFVLSDKLDGISALILKKNNKSYMYSRGDGEYGQDISHLIKLLKLDLSELPEDVCIRGELIMSKDDFQDNLASEMKNARNAVGGIVNAKKNINKEVVKYTNFIAYSIIDQDLTQEEQMKLLKKYKFKVATYKVVKELNYEYLTEYFEKRRKDSDYEIDGIVVFDNSRSYENVKGNPDYGFAFKVLLEEQKAEAIVEDVEWNVSKDGYIKPRIRIKPVKLVGTVITYATAFNAKYVVDNKLGPGAIITIVRSGDVIPDIVEVVKSAKEPKMPDIAYKWNKTKVDIIVKKESNAMRIKQLAHFFKTLEIKNIDEGIITKLVENNYDTVIKIISGDLEEMANIEGLGKKSIEKIMTNINTAFQDVKLEVLMAATNLFGRGMGEKKLKLVLEDHQDILTKEYEEKELLDMLLSVEGFSNISAEKFINGLEKFKDFYEELNKIVKIKLSSMKKKGKLFENKNIVFTGFRDKNLKEYITDNGGKVTDSVSKNTSLVIYIGEDKSSKIKKAEDLKIEIIKLEDFKKKYKII